MSSYPQYSDTEHKERWLRKIQADIEFKKQNEALDVRLYLLRKLKI